jgi:chemotaxis response regulator CheB
VAAVLQGLPRDFPGALIVVQHVDKRFVPGMADWFGRQSALPVHVAADGDRVAVGTVLLAGTDDHLTLTHMGRLAYTTEPRRGPYRPSIDLFLHSVSQHWPGNAIGVLLTGMGKDGALGLRAMRDKGYHTIAQDQASSAVYGMPKAAVTLEAAMDVLPIECIAARLIELLRRRP